MVRTLTELSLQTLCFQFRHVAALLEKQSLSMPSALKAELLQRLVDHDLLATPLLPSITYNLISPALTELDFHRSMSLSDTLLRHIAECCCRFTRIRLSRCPRISDSALADLFINQDALQSVSLNYLLIEGKCLDRLRSPKLMELKLVGCANILPEPVVGCVVANASTIVRLNLKGFRKIHSSNLVKMIDFVGKNLLYLNMSECIQVNDAVLYRIAHKCEKLQTLKVRECMNFFEVSLVDLFERCRQLVELDLSFCVRDEVSGLFEVLPRTLETFRYYGITTNIPNQQMVTNFSQLNSLSTLALNGLNTLSDELLELLMSVIGHQIRVLDLSASFGRFTDTGVDSIVKYCTKLSSLGLGLLSNLSGRPLLPLIENPQRAALLEKLNLSSCTAMTDYVLSAVAENCGNLIFLDISGIQHSNDALLFSLAATTTRLEHLLLKGSRSITDEGVCAVAAACPSLKVISLSGITTISDKSLLALANHCPELEEIYLSGCMVVSQQAIQFLKDSSARRVTCYHVVSMASEQSIVVAKNLDTGEYVRLNMG